MQFSGRKQTGHLKTKAQEYELVPQGEPEAVRRICRFPSRVIQLSTSIRPNIEPGKVNHSLPRFGPLHGSDQQSVLGIKKKAWQHVKKSTKSSVEQGSPKEIFTAAIKRLDKEAREMYAEKISGKVSEFRMTMMKDGCFFIQLAFLILGKSKELGYPENDPIFGMKQRRIDIRKWVQSMFIVGNQIPAVVLKELMKQSFFQEVTAKGNWDLPPSTLCEKTLHELLDLSRVKQHQPKMFSSAVSWIRPPNREVQQQPSDLLHCTYNLVVGSAPVDHKTSKYEAEEDIIDIEANQEDTGDQKLYFPDSGDIESNQEDTRDHKINIPDGEVTATGGATVDSKRVYPKASRANDDNSRHFPCATELKQARIHIKKLESGGSRSIHFESWYFWANLYLPVLPVDDHTEIIFHNLKKYEISQQKRKHNCEVSSYLRLMSEITQSPQDVELLRKKGVVQGRPDYAELLPDILGRLSSEDTTLTSNCRHVRRKIMTYTSPLVHYQGILNVVVFLTVVQAVFAVVSYVRPLK